MLKSNKFIVQQDLMHFKIDVSQITLANTSNKRNLNKIGINEKIFVIFTL